MEERALPVPHPPGRARGGRLGRDQRGATMVIGIFMAIVMVGMLYFVWGIGEAIVYRQEMQDASDAAAYDSAVIEARGMNLIALLNVIMAAGASVETTFDAMVSGLGVATAVATIVCIATEGEEGCDEAETHGEEAADMEDTRSDVEDDMEDILDLAADAADVIKMAYPYIALSRVEDIASEYHPPVSRGFILPINDLPVEDDDSDWPCDEKVAPFASTMAPIGTLLCCDIDIYLLVGAVSSMGFAYSAADDWCDEGYFKRVLEDAEMGDDNFHVRAWMEGVHPFGTNAERVGVATWGEDAPSSSGADMLEELGHWSFAQGEFYFDDDMDREEWLWHMMWRGRLRRFRLSSSDEVPISGLSEVSDVVVH